MEDKIRRIMDDSTDYQTGEVDAEIAISKLLVLYSVSEMFEFAGYLYGNFDYQDNTKDGDIYIHNDNGLKYTREKIYQQWLGTRNSRDKKNKY